MSENTTNQSTLSLKSILVPSKTAEAEFPGFPDFKVNLTFLSRETLVNIRKKATKTTFKGRQVNEELDDELFLKLYVQSAIKGWSGLKLEYVAKLAPVDLGKENPEDTLGFTEENALFLMKNSSGFDAWVSEQVSDLGNFQKSSNSK